MGEVDWKYLFRELFDYQSTLSGDDVRLYVERQGAPSIEIQRQLDELPGRATKFFLSGGPGSGKSSELARLARLLDDDFAVVGLDVHKSAANVTKVAAAEVLFMMGAAAIRLARDRWNHEVSARAQAALLDALRGMAVEPAKLQLDRLVEGTAVLATVGAGAAGLPSGLVEGVGKGIAKLVSAAGPTARVPRPFGGLVREVREGDPEVERLADALSGVLAEVAEVRPPIVLVDGLDRIEELGAIRQLFFHSHLLDLPPCPVVYNGPIALQLNTEAMQLSGSARFESVPLPTIPVEPPAAGRARVSEAQVEEGRDVLRRIIARRLEAQELGLDDVFEGDALERMISWSGGVVRDLIRLVHWSLRLGTRLEQPPDRVTVELAEAAFLKSAREVQSFASNALRIGELEAVERDGEPSGTDEGLRLQLRGAILTYQDHVPWYRVHPLLRPLLGSQGDPEE